MLRQALEGWSEVLGELSTQPLRKAFVAAIRQAEGWTLPGRVPRGPQGGGGVRGRSPAAVAGTRGSLAGGRAPIGLVHLLAFLAGRHRREKRRSR